MTLTDEENDFVLDAINHYSNWADQMLNNKLIEMSDGGILELRIIKRDAKLITDKLPEYSEKELPLNTES